MAAARDERREQAEEGETLVHHDLQCARTVKEALVSREKRPTHTNGMQEGDRTTRTPCARAPRAARRGQPGHGDRALTATGNCFERIMGLGQQRGALHVTRLMRSKRGTCPA